MSANNGSKAKFTVPGLELKDGQKVGKALQMRLHALNDLQLTLKHAHWNVVGQNFIGVHEMLDPQVASIRIMVDALAERMATLGVAPNGLAGDLVKQRSWDDYSINRASTGEHLAALDLVFSGVIGSMRECIAEVGALDPVTEDLLIGQTGELEQFQWFIRSHLENDQGELLNAAAKTEKDAAAKAK